MKVSVIIPIFNVEPYLEECVNSVLRQKHEDMEIILVDDGSPDACPQMCDNYAANDNRIKVVHRLNGGLSAARNSGLDIATGDYVYFLDSDDKLFDEAIPALVALAKKYPGVDMVQGNMLSQNGESTWRFTKNDFPEFSDDREWVRDQLLHWKIGVSAWNKLYRLGYLREHKMRFMEGIVHEDVKWCWDNQKRLTSVAFCYQTCYWYRTDNSTSIMHNVDKTKTLIAFLKIADAIRSELGDVKDWNFLKDYILPIKPTVFRWLYVKDRPKVITCLRDLQSECGLSPLGIRCIILYLLFLLFPCQLYKRIYHLEP